MKLNSINWDSKPGFNPGLESWIVVKKSSLDIHIGLLEQKTAISFMLYKRKVQPQAKFVPTMFLTYEKDHRKL